MTSFQFSSRITAAGLGVVACVGLLSGCSHGGGQTDKKDNTFQMQVEQVEQLSKLGDKSADGQYLIVKTLMKNTGNKPLVLNQPDFVLQNITENEKDRYSEAPEKIVVNNFVKTYGDADKDKVMDYGQTNMNPRLSLERYFVFMVPADAKPDQYQITYNPTKTTVPLVASTTTINDRRDTSVPQP